MNFGCVGLGLDAGQCQWAMSGSCTLGTLGYRLWLKILDTIGSLQWQTVGEPYTPYQETVPPLQAEEGGGTNLKRTNPENNSRQHFSSLQLA
jgi:hypothetical protein